MPTWDFECQCGHRERKETNVCNVETVRPQHCGAPMEIDWSGGKIATSVFQAFDTKNIDPEGRSVHVGSRKELSSLMNKHGLNHVDDPGISMQGGQLVKKSPAIGRKYFT